MEMQSLESRAVSHAGYDPQTKTLRVAFNYGGTYEYFDVPAELYSALLESKSKGNFIVENLVGSGLRYKRV